MKVLKETGNTISYIKIGYDSVKVDMAYDPDDDRFIFFGDDELKYQDMYSVYFEKLKIMMRASGHGYEVEF